MSERERRIPVRLRWRRILALAAFSALLGFVVAVGRPATAVAEGEGELVAEPILSATAAGVKELYGTTPVESPGEVWGVAEQLGLYHFVHYTEAGGWETVEDPIGPGGETISLGQSSTLVNPSAGRTTPAGGVATVAPLEEAEGKSMSGLYVRDPGGRFRAVLPPSEPILLENERILPESSSANIKLAAVEEPDGHTGAFVVPDPGNKLNTGVLHYDGTKWSREPILLGCEPECKESIPVGFNVAAIEVAGPGVEMMLASSPREGVILLRREEGQWRQQKLGGALGAIFSQGQPELEGIEGIEVRKAGSPYAQPLTVTSKGAWFDATIKVAGVGHDATAYYDLGEGDPQQGEVTGSWCDLPEATPEPGRHELCEFPLGSDLASGPNRSFAWPGTGAPGDYGTRAITGVGQGAMLIFENGAWSRAPLAGNGGGIAGAALTAPDQGWLGPSYRLTRAPIPSGLAPWPIPFRRPLVAIAPQPGAPVASLESQALAVGAAGQVARYLPGVGWQPEALLTGSGTRATPELRAVAWPQPSTAFAVGTEGAMWLWRGSTGFWEPDPGAPPNLVRGNFTGIAFDPGETGRGYAVGQQGLLLAYGKRWTQESLPSGLDPESNITSIAFAGNQAIATWDLAVPLVNERGEPTTNEEVEYTGGVIVNEGSGWRVDEEATKLMEAVESGSEGFAPRKVAGLPDGGAVVVGIGGKVIEREAVGAPWHVAPGAPVGYPSAVAAIREGGQVRALLTVGQDGQSSGTELYGIDKQQAFTEPSSLRPPLLTAPYPLPLSSFLVRQTATGWRDEERQDFPDPPQPTDQSEGSLFVDLPREPDPLLALLVDPTGQEAWAVGGQTGEKGSEQFGPSEKEGLRTAAVMRFGPAATPPSNEVSTPLTIGGGEEATFAIGGGANCAGACADLAHTEIGPDVWMHNAVARAASIPGLRAFLYTGSGVSPHLDQADLTSGDFGAEENAYARRLDSSAEELPVFAAPSASDLFENSLATFASRFSGFPQPLGIALSPGIAPLPSGEREAGNYSYAFESENEEGTGVVRVIVLDESTTPLSTEKQCWLVGQLSGAGVAGTPAIVIGNREVGADGGLAQILVTGQNSACTSSVPASASAYFYEAHANRVSNVAYGGFSIPAVGTGTLGYSRPGDTTRNQYVPASGFLLASVNVAARSPRNNVAPVSVRLIPNIGSLAINALDGTFLRRSQTALFEGLARRPIAGEFCEGNQAPLFCSTRGPDPFVQIPARCIAEPTCPSEVLPEYRFSSSRPDIADFVKVDPNSRNPRAVALQNGKPVPDPTSGLLCAFNSGTTTVSLETGGFSYSVPVTVQKGSVAQPCGTVPRTDLTAPPPPVETPPPPLESEPPFEGPGHSLPTPVEPGVEPHPTPVEPTPPAPPRPLPARHPVPPVPPPPILPAFIVPTPLITPLAVIVPPPPPPGVEPAPPTGTSPVTEPAVSPEPEEEEEAAFDLVHHAVAYRSEPRRSAALAASRSHQGQGLPSYSLPVLLVLAAVAGGSVAGRRRRPGPQFAENRTTPRRRRF